MLESAFHPSDLLHRCTTVVQQEPALPLPMHGNVSVRCRCTCRTDLHFVEVSDAGIFTEDVLNARKEREQRSLVRFVQDMKHIDSLGCFSEWLHDTHLCYAVSRQHEIGMSTNVSDEALASY